jgi:hypothetical protein
MKRKSILTTIVAILFAGAAWGQEIPWPAASDVLSTVKDRDTIYLCASTDSLYPIELGYDVAGKRLHPSYGNWSLISRTSNEITAIDYNMDGTKNGGAGNAYKTVGSGIGGLLFQYEAKDKQCGYDEGDKHWVYVFVMPDEKNVIDKDTIICYVAPPTSYQTINLHSSFAKYKTLYEQAGLIGEWKVNQTYNVRKDSLATYTYTDSIIVKPSNNSVAFTDYTCGDTIIFKLKVTVDSSFIVPRATLIKCIDDTVGDLGKRKVYEVFQRDKQGYAGTYNPATINEGAFTPIPGSYKINGHDVTGVYKEYVFTPTAPCVKNGPVRDTIYFLDKGIGYWDKSTVTYCRDSTEVSLQKLWGYITTPKPDLFQNGANTSSYWEDRGIKDPFVAPYDHGTIISASNPSGQNPSLPAGTYSLLMSIMKSNVGYQYLWRPDPASFPCLVDVNGIPDSGIMVVILKDPAIAQDYTAQLCKDSYAATKFYLNPYTGLDVDWKQPLSGGNAAGLEGRDTVVIAKVPKGTYKYAYELPANCGPGGKGVFYLKVTDKIKVPTSKTVKFCVDKLPATINVNDVLGVAVSSLKWKAEINSTALSTGFSDSGILDVNAFVGTYGSGAQNIVFTVTSGGDCGVVNNTTTVTVQFVTTI